MNGGQGGRRVSRRRALTIGGAAAVTALAATGTPDSSTGVTSDNGGPVDRAHAAGVTGAGVRVGVLDTTGFAPSHRALDGRVTALRSFDSAPLVVDRVSHGTAAAATVARMAPDCELLLASFSRPDGFTAALDWFVRRGADVLLAPVAAHGSGGTDSAVVRAATAAVEAGLPVVAPTGNAARGHWSGPLGAAVGRTLELHPLSSNDRLGGELVAWLSPGDVGTDLSLKLVRLTETGDGRDLIALSQPSRWGHAEKLSAALDPGKYVLEMGVPGHEGVPETADELPVSVATPTHAVTPTRPAGSIAPPASAPGVLAVGAVSDGRLAPYSGRGPTADGHIGVDVVTEPGEWIGSGAPATSGAAARAAGTAALVLGVDPSLTPGDLRELLHAAAADMGRGTPNLGTGWGRLDPLASVQRARATS